MAQMPPPSAREPVKMVIGVGTVARLTSQLQRHASGEYGNGQ